MSDIPKRYRSAVDFVNYDSKSMEEHINSLIEKTQRHVKGFELVSASACPAPHLDIISGSNHDIPDGGYTTGNIPVADPLDWVVVIAYKYYDERDIPKCNRGYSDNYPSEYDESEGERIPYKEE